MSSSVWKKTLKMVRLLQAWGLKDSRLPASDVGFVYSRASEDWWFVKVAAKMDPDFNSGATYFFPLPDGFARRPRPFKAEAGTRDRQVSSYDISAQRPNNYHPDVEFLHQDRYPQVYGEFVWTEAVRRTAGRPAALRIARERDSRREAVARAGRDSIPQPKAVREANAIGRASLPSP